MNADLDNPFPGFCDLFFPHKSAANNFNADPELINDDPAFLENRPIIREYPHTLRIQKDIKINTEADI